MVSNFSTIPAILREVHYIPDHKPQGLTVFYYIDPEMDEKRNWHRRDLGAESSELNYEN